MDDVLGRLRLIILLVALGGIAIAAALGLAVGRAALAPVRRLTETAEEITATRTSAGGWRPSGATRSAGWPRASTRCSGARGLDPRAAPARRRRLPRAEDAAHEPAHERRAARRGRELPDGGARARWPTCVAQIEELTALVADVVEMARDGEPRHDVEEVRLDEVVADAVARARLHSPQISSTRSSSRRVVRACPSACTGRSRTCSTTPRSGARRAGTST